MNFQYEEQTLNIRTKDYQPKRPTWHNKCEISKTWLLDDKILFLVYEYQTFFQLFLKN